MSDDDPPPAGGGPPGATAPEAGPAARHAAAQSKGAATAPLRIARFRRMWMGSFVFSLGHFVQMVAGAWLMLELTGSPLWVGLMTATPFAPLFILSLPAGALADMVNRKPILQVSAATMIVAAGAVAVTTVLGLITPVLLLLLSLLTGTGAAFFNPAWMATLPRLVPLAILPAAVGLNATLNGVTAAAGPALGGLLVATLGAGPTYAVATVGYVAIFTVVSVTAIPSSDASAGSLRIALGTGLRYLRFSPDYRILLLFGAMFGLTAAAFRALLPNITNDVLMGDSALYGILLACFGIGSAVGGLTLSKVAPAIGQHLVAISVITFGLAAIVLSLTSVIAVAAVALVIIGLQWSWVVSTLNTVFQLLTPTWVLGRAMSAYIMAVFGMMPIGSFASGALGDIIGAGPALLVFSLLVVGIGLAALRMQLPSVGGIDPPQMPDEPDEQVATDVVSAPVMVTTTWQLVDDDLDAFVDVLRELRRVRLSTGAYSWSAYRSAHDANRITEVFMVHTWEQHLLQHRRLNLKGIGTVLRAESFGEQVMTDHLIAFDVEDPQVRTVLDHQIPANEQAHHEQVHRARRAQPAS